MDRWRFIDLFSLEEGIKDCHTVIHCAAIVSFNPKDFEKMMKQNVDGTANIVNICLEHNIEKLGIYKFYCYSSSVEENKVRTEDRLLERK